MPLINAPAFAPELLTLFDALKTERVDTPVIQPAEPFITRVELVGGRFAFAMRSSTQGGFELCPWDVCQAEKKRPDVCPADGSATFMPSPLTADDPLVKSFERLCTAEGIDLGGIEFLEDAKGQRFTYDINANTNYNAAFGRSIGVDGMRDVARWIRREVVPTLR